MWFKLCFAIFSVTAAVQKPTITNGPHNKSPRFQRASSFEETNQLIESIGACIDDALFPNQVIVTNGLVQEYHGQAYMVISFNTATKPVQRTDPSSLLTRSTGILWSNSSRTKSSSAFISTSSASSSSATIISHANDCQSQGESTVGGACQLQPTDAGNRDHVTFRLFNSMGGSISISYELNIYSTEGGEPITASSLLGPTASTGIFADATTVVAPFGWAGRMTVGKASGPLDFRGTKIEGNNGFSGGTVNANPNPDIDVSYVDGYSVPAICACGNKLLTGCNKELWDTGIECTNIAGSGENRICINQPRSLNGTATPFFAPCAHQAYTYDYDDFANWQGICPGSTFDCCIGHQCGIKSDATA